MITTIDQKFAELLNNWQVNGWPIGNLMLVLIAIFLSVLLCGTIGIEREWRGRNAGLRTHLLVGVGSCIIMIISIYGFPAMFGEKRDVARLAAQIITGVGFLGAGAIIHRNNGTKGLTTAGTIWIVMAIGIACGSFNFFIAIISTFVIFIVLTVFRKVEAKLSKNKMMLMVIAPTDKPVLAKTLAIAAEFDAEVSILSQDFVSNNGESHIEFLFKVVFVSGQEPIPSEEFIKRLCDESGAKDIHPLTIHH